MAAITKAHGKTTESKVTDNTFGATDDHTRDSGRTIKCMGMVSMCGKMAGSMKETMFMTKNKAKVSTTGRMGSDLRGVG